MKKEVPAEFVTAGGITRKEIDFHTMESKRIPNFYFAGESTASPVASTFKPAGQEGTLRAWRWQRGFDLQD
jgi:hypothetical protein